LLGEDEFLHPTVGVQILSHIARPSQENINTHVRANIIEYCSVQSTHFISSTQFGPSPMPCWDPHLPFQGLFFPVGAAPSAPVES